MARGRQNTDWGQVSLPFNSVAGRRGCEKWARGKLSVGGLVEGNRGGGSRGRGVGEPRNRPALARQAARTGSAYLSSEKLKRDARGAKGGERGIPFGGETPYVGVRISRREANRRGIRRKSPERGRSDDQASPRRKDMEDIKKTVTSSEEVNFLEERGKEIKAGQFPCTKPEDLRRRREGGGLEAMGTSAGKGIYQGACSAPRSEEGLKEGKSLMPVGGWVAREEGKGDFRSVWEVVYVGTESLLARGLGDHQRGVGIARAEPEDVPKLGKRRRVAGLWRIW